MTWVLEAQSKGGATNRTTEPALTDDLISEEAQQDDRRGDLVRQDVDDLISNILTYQRCHATESLILPAKRTFYPIKIPSQ